MANEFTPFERAHVYLTYYGIREGIGSFCNYSLNINL